MSAEPPADTPSDVPSAMPADVPPVDPPADPTDPSAVWSAVLDAAPSRVIASVVRGCELVELDRARAVLRASPTIGRLAHDRAGEIEKLLLHVLGSRRSIEFAAASRQEDEASHDRQKADDAPMSESSDPLVAEAARLFNARVAGVHPKARGSDHAS